MDDQHKQQLKGSEKRDAFKRAHKDLDKKFYATDADLCLIHKYPPGTVAYLDYKAPSDNVTFTEVIQYNVWMTQAPVYIVESPDPENGPFTIYRYLGGDWQPNPPTWTKNREAYCQTWIDVEKWERSLRDEYARRGGWNGCLRTKDEEAPHV